MSKRFRILFFAMFFIYSLTLLSCDLGGVLGGLTGNTEKQEASVLFMVDDELYHRITLKEGDLIEKPANPTKAGYKFVGWYSDYDLTNKYDFTKAISGGNLILYAKFEKIGGGEQTGPNTDVYYTVTFYVEGVVYNSQKVLENTVYTFPAAPVKEGYNFIGWYYNGSLVSNPTNVTYNIALEARFEEIKLEDVYYTVTYLVDGVVYDTHEVLKDTIMSDLPIPTKEGHEFVGWMLNGKLWNESNKVTENIILIARFEEEVKEVYYTVEFIVDGKVYDTQQVLEKTSYKFPANPVKEGYKFIGWYYNGQHWNFETPVTSNMVMEAKFEEEVKEVYYTVEFVVDGKVYEIQTVKEYTYITPINAPTKEGYNFLGWYYKGQKWDFNQDVKCDLELEAVYEHSHIHNYQPIFTFDIKWPTPCSVKFVCSDDENHILPSSEYDFNLTTQEYVASTCATKGYVTYLASAKYDNVIYEETKTFVFEKLEHNYNEEYVCDNCGYEYYSEGLEFTLSNSGNTYYITGYTGIEEDVIIPSSYNNKPVNQIINLSNNNTIVSVRLPDTIELIEAHAFSNCTNLVTIAIPDKVTGLYLHAFDGCSSLEYVVIPEGFTGFGGSVFANCDKLTQIYYKGSLEKWNELYFYDTKWLEQCTVYFYSEEEPTTVGNYWHYVNGEPTAWDVELCTLTLMVDNEVYKTIDVVPGQTITLNYGPTKENHHLWWTDELGVMYYENTDITVNENTVLTANYHIYECIVEYIFEYNDVKHSNQSICSYGETIELQPATLEGYEFIGWYKDSTYTDEVKTLEYQDNTITVYGKFVEIPYTFKEYEDHIEITGYKGNEVNVVIPDYIYGKPVTVIGEYSLDHSSFESVVIGNNVERIEAGAFAVNAIVSLHISSSVVYIANNAFIDSTRLDYITVDENNAVYDSRENCNAIIETATNKLIKGIPNTTIPNTVVTIGENAFAFIGYSYTGNGNTIYVMLPSSVTTIEANSFENSGFSTVYYEGGKSDSYYVKGLDELSEMTVYPNESWNLVDGKPVDNILHNNGYYYIENEQAYLEGLKDSVDFVIPTSVNGYPVVQFDEKSFWNNVNATVYFEGTEEEWNEINKLDNPYKVLFYLNTTTTYPSSYGAYWHYIDGEPKEVFEQEGDFTYWIIPGIECSELALYTGNDKNVIIPDNFNNKFLYSIYTGTFKNNGNIQSIRINGQLRTKAIDNCSNLEYLIISTRCVMFDKDSVINCDKLSTIYYEGTQTQWEETFKYSDKEWLDNCTVYFLSETEPTTAGNYWHYDENNNPTMWPEVILHTVKFIANGVVCEEIEVVHGNTIDFSLVPNVEEKGYEDDGWGDIENKKFYFGYDIVTSDLTLYKLKLTPKTFWITFEFNFTAEAVYANNSYKAGEIIDLTTWSATKYGYEFVGWCKDDTYSEFVYEIGSELEDITLYGKFEMLEFVFNWYGGIIEKYQFNNSTVIIPETINTFEVKEIASTFFENENINKVIIGTNITTITYYPTTTNKDIEIFYTSNKTEWDKIDKNIGVQAMNVYFYSEEAPTTVGNYWHYVNGEPTAWDVELCTLTLMVDNEVYKTIDVVPGQTITLNYGPTKENHHLWWTDELGVMYYENTDITVNENTVLTANYHIYECIVEYIFEYNDVKHSNQSICSYGETIELQPATLEGYEFIGWYKDSTYTDEVKTLEYQDNTITVYGKFVEIPYTFKEYEDHIEITGYKGNEVNVVIPDYIYGKPVTVIGEYSLDHSSFESVVIGNNVERIEAGAFAVNAIVSLHISSSVVYIANNAFIDSTRLDYITVDENNAVYDSRENCNAIIETATNKLIKGIPNTTIPNTVVTIGENAFAFIGYSYTGNGNTIYVMLPSSVTTIEANSFENSGFSTVYYEGGKSDSYYVKGLDELSEMTVYPNESWNLVDGKPVDNILHNNGYYYIENEQAYLEGLKDSVDFVIPTSVNGYPVVQFDEKSFWNHVNATVYFEGTEEEWNEINKLDNPYKVLFYVERLYDNYGQLNIKEYGEYWHYEGTIPTSWFEYNNGFYYIDNGTYYILGKYVGNNTTVEVPKELSNLHILKNTFNNSYSEQIKELIISDNVIRMDYGSLYGCNQLETLTAPFIGGFKNENQVDIRFMFYNGDNFNVPTTLKKMIITDENVIGCQWYNNSYIEEVVYKAPLTRVELSALSTCPDIKQVFLPADIEYLYCGYIGENKDISYYYNGTLSDFESITIDGDIDLFNFYCYSEEEPTTEGNYWHYVDGEPVVWPEYNPNLYKMEIPQIETQLNSKMNLNYTYSLNPYTQIVKYGSSSYEDVIFGEYQILLDDTMTFDDSLMSYRTSIGFSCEKNAYITIYASTISGLCNLKVTQNSNDVSISNLKIDGVSASIFNELEIGKINKYEFYIERGSNYYLSASSKGIVIYGFSIELENVPYYQVNYSVDGSIYCGEVVRQGDTTISPMGYPAKEGYNFIGWYYNGQLWNHDTPVTSDMVLEAMYEEIPKHTVMFMVDGEVYQTLEVIDGQSVSFDNAPTKEGYSFVNWLDNSNNEYYLNNEYTFTSDITLTANFYRYRYNIDYVFE